MNKKFLIAIVVILAVVLVAGYFVFQYSTQIKENSAPAPQVQITPEGIKTDDKWDGFTICLDKCGDNICQVSDPACKDNDNKMNCICPETPESCPQDCK